MASIAVPAGQSGTIIPLEVVPATNGSGTYVLVVSLQDPNLDIGTVDVALTYNHNPPVLNDGQTTGFQSDIHGNLKVNIAGSSPDFTIGAVSIDGPLPAGSNTIGGIYQAPSSSADFALAPGSSTQWEHAHIIKESAGNLYSLNIITGAASGFLMTFDSETIPADGPVNPVECVPVPANSFAAIRSFGSPPDHYTSGIVAVFSVTGPFTKTTTSSFGNQAYGNNLYGSNASALAFFKWSVQ